MLDDIFFFYFYLQCSHALRVVIWSAKYSKLYSTLWTQLKLEQILLLSVARQSIFSLVYVLNTGCQKKQNNRQPKKQKLLH